MDRETLERGDGKEGRPAYVGHDGTVYDVTGSRLWKGGTHMNLHHAGQDLSEHLAMAPHGVEVFERVGSLGALEEAPADERDQRQELKESLAALYQKFHPHPITIHFPIAVFIFSSLFHILFLVTGRESLAAASLYAFMFAALSAPVAIASGFLSWWLNYNSTLTSIFRNKIFGSMLLLLVSTAVLAIRLANPSIIHEVGAMGWIFHGLVISVWPIVGFIGYQGGKITFPS